jgi:hypothetical protein
MKKSQQRKVLRAIFDNAAELTESQLKDSQILKSLLKVECPKAIQDAIENKKSFACVFEINNSNSFIEIHKNYWADVLGKCLNWYLEDGTEDYETCNHISKMIESLKTHKK